MKKKMRISSRKQVMLIIGIFVVPLVCLLIIYNLYTVGVLNQEVAETGKNTIFLYQDDLEKNLYRTEIAISDYWGNDYDHQRTRFDLSKLDSYIVGNNIISKYTSMLQSEDIIGAMFLAVPKNDIFRVVFQGDGYHYKIRQGAQSYARKLAAAEMNAVKQGWIVKKIEDQYFLFRMMGWNGAYTICMIDLEVTLKPQDSVDTQEGAFMLYSDWSEKPLTSINTVRENGIELLEENESYYISGEEQRYLIVQNRLESVPVNMVYLVPYRGLFFHMDWIQILVLAFSIVLLLLIPICYELLSWHYFKPLERLIRTMEKIKSGNLDAKMKSEYRIQEFEKVSVTFNEMMEEIKDLKIEAYEHEIRRKQTELQYLQLQIKPHFFLNCLKILYGMAEQKRYDKVQNMILSISDYMRYIFRDNMAMVPLKTEIGHVENYINLQKSSGAQEVECSFQIEPGVEEYLLPILCIQTFVENSFKYAAKPGRTLKVAVSAILLEWEDERYIDITIEDNGDGFSQELLNRFKEKPLFQYQEKQVGILNVRQRLYLLYGEKADVACINTDTGAQCEIIIPIQEKTERGETE